jgi:mRNA interferase MazF
MSSGAAPVRGEVWMADLGFGRGREQSGTRPALIVSMDGFNRSGAELAIMVAVLPPEANLVVPSYIKCEDIRSISTDRLIRLMGIVSPTTLIQVEIRMRFLLGL